MDANLPLLHISLSAPLVPSPAKHEARGLRRSPTSWKLGALASTTDDDDALSATDSEEEFVEAAAGRRTKRARSVWMQKPPRHKGMPTGVQSVLNLWKRVLRRDDVSVMSDFFHDLDGSDELAWELIEQMQLLGVSISIQQLYALRRCCVYTVLLTAL